jgi:GT2 family glycosyltransferase
VQYHRAPIAGAAMQRDYAIHQTALPLILLCEDDVELEPGWVENLLRVVERDRCVGAAMGRIVNQPYLTAPGIWRGYRLLVAGPARARQPGAVVGALVANGFPPDAAEPLPTEWIGGGVTLVRRAAYVSVGGFAPHFRGSSPGEDIDLGFRISRAWQAFYVPAARCVHHQLSTGREPVDRHQFLSMRSRFAFCRASAGMSAPAAFAHIGLWALVQTLSEIGQLRRGRLRRDFLAACAGRLRGAWSCLGWNPASDSPPAWRDTHVRA